MKNFENENKNNINGGANMNIETKKETSIVELQEEYTENGVKFGIIKVDGEPFVSLGYSSEEDKEKAVNAVRIAIERCGGDRWKARNMMSTLCALGDKEVKADAEVEVKGIRFIISYAKKAAYDKYGNEVTNLEDLREAELPDIAIKTLLVERIKTALLEDRLDYYEDDYFDEEEEDEE